MTATGLGINTTSPGIFALNVSGNTLLSSLNISGTTIIGSDIYNYSDSSFELNKNIIVRNSTTSGSRINLQVGQGYEKSYL